MSAFQDHVVAVEWIGQNSLSPVMNEISGGMTNLGRQQQQLGRQFGSTFGYWGQQMRVLRRSAEYMVAGFGMYKIVQAFQNYRQFRSELGNLNANLNIGQGALNDWGRAAIDVSNRTATPLDQIVESFQNLAASFPELNSSAKAHLFPVMAEIEARASRIMSTSSGTSQVAPQQFGATVLQAARSFYGAQAVERSVRQNPQGRNLLEQTASQVLTAMMRTPGTTGSQLINYLPTLFGGARAGRFSLPQAMAMFNVAQRVGGRPAQTIQYLRQLMLRIRRPTAAEAPFFKQAGIDVNNMGSMGGFQIVQQLLRHAASLPGGVTPQQIRQMMRQGNTQGVNLRGPAAQFLQNAIGGRIQSLVAITQLSTGMGDLNKEVDQYKNHLIDVNAAYTRWEAQNQLTVAANRMSNFSTSLINSFNPLINVLATSAGDLAQWGLSALNWAGRVDKSITQGAIGKALHLGQAQTGAEVFGLAYALRAGLPPGIGNTVGRIPGIGKFLRPIFQMGNRERGFFGRAFGRGAGEAATAAEESAVAPGALATAFSRLIAGPLDIRAVSSALTGTANGTPVAPFWVVIHPLSKATVPGLFGYGPNSPSLLSSLEKDITPTAAGGYALKKIFPRLGRLGGRFGGAGEAATGVGEATSNAGIWLPEGVATTAGRVGRFARLGRLLSRGGRFGRFGELLGRYGMGLDFLAPPFAAYGMATQPGNLSAKLSFGAFGSGSGTIYHAAAARGRIWTRVGNQEMARQVSASSVLGRYLTATGGQLPAGLIPLVTAFNERKISQGRVERAITHYARSNLLSGALGRQMTSRQANAFYKYVDPIYNLGGRTRFVHQAMRQGGFEGYADVVVELQPTQELKDLVKPPQRKVHVRVPITHSPTSRGGKPTHRSR